MTQALAVTYAIATALPLAMQLGLILGAPWGRLTLGGRWPGVLPLAVRPFAGLAALLLIWLITVVLDHAGLIAAGYPDWMIWPALALTILTTIANLATPSRPERMLWGPVTLIMSASLGLLLLL